jgi:hypothetical protein
MAAVAAFADVAPDLSIAEPGQFAGEEIRRGAAASGLTLGHGPAATRLALTVEGPPHAIAQKPPLTATSPPRATATCAKISTSSFRKNPPPLSRS